MAIFCEKNNGMCYVHTVYQNKPNDIQYIPRLSAPLYHISNITHFSTT